MNGSTINFDKHALNLGICLSFINFSILILAIVSAMFNNILKLHVYGFCETATPLSIATSGYYFFSFPAVCYLYGTNCCHWCCRLTTDEQHSAL